MVKLIIAMLAGNCENTIGMTIKSVLNMADEFVIIYDTTSKDKTYDIIEEFRIKYPGKFTIIRRDYEHNPLIKNSNSNARNCYLNYLKDNFDGEWCLVLDGDECVSDFNKAFLEQFKDEKLLLSPRIHHFVFNLGHEDATRDKHYVPNRLFKIDKSLVYPEGEHPVLVSKNMPEWKIGNIEYPIIWHFREASHIFDILKKHKNNWEKSNIHSKNYLLWWYYSMLFGSYPVKKTYYGELPQVIKEEFNI